MRLTIALLIALLDMSAIPRSAAQVASVRDTVVPATVARVISDGARAELLLINGPRDTPMSVWLRCSQPR